MEFSVTATWYSVTVMKESALSLFAIFFISVVCRSILRISSVCARCFEKYGERTGQYGDRTVNGASASPKKSGIFGS